VIVFGWGGGRVKHHGDAVYLTCSHCSNSVFYRLVSVTQWFRLYWIPVFPYSRKWLIACPICSAGRQLTGVEIETTRELVEVVKQLGNDDRDVAAYARAMSAWSEDGSPLAAAQLPALPPHAS
jgi:hypothetical protein